MIYDYRIHDITVYTGDILCTTDGAQDLLPGEFWRLIGRLLPGDVDHIAIYIGPGGRCVEAGAFGVVTFEVPDSTWDARQMMVRRGAFADTFYGAVFPLQHLGLASAEEVEIRTSLAAYCLAQAGKPYNLNYFDPETEEAFYCSQLAYKAYQHHGINLNTGRGIEHLPGSGRIVFPQEIWDGFPHRRASKGILDDEMVFHAQ